jgi:hypothetical protein
MVKLNNKLGDLILLEEVDEFHFKEIGEGIRILARSCQSMLKDEWRFIEDDVKLS